MSTSNVLAEIVAGEEPRPAVAGLAPRPFGPPAAGDMPAILAAAQQEAGPPLRIRRYFSDEGQPFWRWDCETCGEYGGGRHHPDAVSRAMRHCGEHPEHRSSLLPPALCRQRDAFLPLHPMLFAVDDDPPPPPI